jgi:hypothetical protein
MSAGCSKHNYLERSPSEPKDNVVDHETSGLIKSEYLLLYLQAAIRRRHPRPDVFSGRCDILFEVHLRLHLPKSTFLSRLPIANPYACLVAAVYCACPAEPKVKLCHKRRTRAEVWLHAFLISALHGAERSRSHPGPFTPRKETPVSSQYESGWAQKSVWTF